MKTTRISNPPQQYRRSRINTTKISRYMFYRLGGFANPDLFRQHNGRSWSYYEIFW